MTLLYVEAEKLAKEAAEKEAAAAAAALAAEEGEDGEKTDQPAGMSHTQWQPSWF